MFKLNSFFIWAIVSKFQTDENGLAFEIFLNCEIVSTFHFNNGKIRSTVTRLFNGLTQTKTGFCKICHFSFEKLYQHWLTVSDHFWLTVHAKWWSDREEKTHQYPRWSAGLSPMFLDQVAGIFCCRKLACIQSNEKLFHIFLILRIIWDISENRFWLASWTLSHSSPSGTWKHHQLGRRRKELYLKTQSVTAVTRNCSFLPLSYSLH